jgi:fibronectin type 3 domain-containing protein
MKYLVRLVITWLLLAIAGYGQLLIKDPIIIDPGLSCGYAIPSGYYGGITSENLGAGFHVNSGTVDQIRYSHKTYNGSNSFVGNYTRQFEAASVISNSLFSVKKVMAGDTSSAPFYTMEGHFNYNVFNCVSSVTSTSGLYYSNGINQYTASTKPTWTAYYIGASSTAQAPQGLAAVALDDDRVELSWGAVTGAYVYYVYRATSSNGTYFLVDSSNTVSKVVANHTAGTLYYYKVRSRNVYSTSAYSGYSSARLFPAAPARPSVTAVASGLQVSWTAVSSATSYKVYRSTTYNGVYSHVQTSSLTNYTNTGLASNTRYYYKVSAVNASGEGSQSSYQSALTLPSAPTNVTAVEQSAQSINISWTAASGSITKYFIYRSTLSEGVYALVDSTLSGAYVSKTVTGHLANTSYHFKVKSKNSSGYSDFSASDSATTLLSTPVLTIDSSLFYSVFFSWAPVAGAQSYSLQISANAMDWDTLAVTSANNWVQDTGLVIGQSYFYRVQAQSAQNTSEYSLEQQVSVKNKVAPVPYWESFETEVGSEWVYWVSSEFGRVQTSSEFGPLSGTGHLVLDRSGSGALNQSRAILSVALQAANGMDLVFWNKSLGDEPHTMPQEYVGNATGDGVSISVDGTRWYRIVNLAQHSQSDWKKFIVNLDSVAAALGVAWDETVHINFQQYDNGEAPSDGHAFDSIGIVPRPVLSVTAGPNGSVSESGFIPVPYGENKTIALLPNANYQVSSVLLDDVAVPFDTAGNAFHLANVRLNQTLQVQFALQQYAVQVGFGAGGECSEQGEVMISHGSALLVECTPLIGYQVDSVLVNGVNVGAVPQYEFMAVTQPSTLQVYFGKKEYVVRAFTGVGGQVLGVDSITVLHGDSAAVAFSAAVGFQIDSLLYKGVGAGDSLHFVIPEVTAPDTVWAFFKKQTFTVSVSSGENGSVLPAVDTVVCYGDSVPILFTGAPGFVVDSVVINELNVGSVSAYTIYNVTQNHTVQAWFKEAPDVFYTIQAQAVIYDAEGGSGGLLGDAIGGSINPQGDVVVGEGSSILFQFLAQPGYQIHSVLVDEAPVGTPAFYEFTNVQSHHSVTVQYAPIQYTVAYEGSVGGDVAPFVDTLLGYGEVLAIHVQALQGYAVDSVLINEQPYELEQGLQGVAIDLEVIENATVRAVFAKRSYTVQVAIPTGGGSVEQGLEHVVEYGDDITLHLINDQHWQIDSIIVNGENLGANTEWQQQNVQTNYAIQVYFSPVLYAVQVLPVPNDFGVSGTIQPQGLVYVSYFDTLQLQVQPNAGYELVSISIDGEHNGNLEQGFVDIAENLEVQVLFAPKDYWVLGQAGPNGSVSPADTVWVKYGEPYVLTATPSEGFAVQALTVNGEQVGSAQSYAIDFVDTNYVVQASFEVTPMQQYTLITQGYGNGVVVPGDTSSISAGKEVTIVSLPERGYVIDSMYVNGVKVAVEGGQDVQGMQEAQVALSAYSLPNVQADYYVQVWFGVQRLFVQTQASEGGVIDTLQSLVPYGQPISVHWQANPGYEVDSVYINSIAWGALDSFALDSLHANIRIRVVFTPAMYSLRGFTGLTAGETAGGQVIPGGIKQVQGGSTHSYSFVPFVGYVIQNIMVNDSIIGAVPAYTLPPVWQNYEVQAHFAPLDQGAYTITTQSTLGGSLSPAGTWQVAPNSKIVLHSAANDGYQLDYVVVNEDTMQVDNLLVLQTVQQDYNIRAYYSKQEYQVQVQSNMDAFVGVDTAIVFGGSLALPLPVYEGYSVDSVVINQQNQGSLLQIALQDIAANQTVYVYYSPTKYSIPVVVYAAGQAQIDTVLVVAHGDSAVVHSNPANGWQTDSLAIGQSVQYGDTMQVQVVQADTAYIWQSAIPYTLAVSSHAGGEVVGGEATYYYADTVPLIAVPQAGYTVHAWVVQGDTVQEIAGLEGVPNIWFASSLDTLYLSVVQNTSIHALFKPIQVPLSIQAHDGGFVKSLSGEWVLQLDTTVDYGEPYNLEWSTESGYVLDSISINDSIIVMADDSVYTIEPSSLSVETVETVQYIQLHFSLPSYSIQVVSNVGGQVTALTDTIRQWGQDFMVHIQPDTGKVIQQIVLNGEEQPVNTHFVIPSVQQDYTLEVVFAVQTFTVQVFAGLFGVVSQKGAVTVEYGDSLHIAFAGKPGYTVDSVIVNGQLVHSTQGYVFTNISDNQEIRVVFAKPTIQQGQAMVLLFYETPSEYIHYETHQVQQGDSLSVAWPAWLLESNNAYAIQSVLLNDSQYTQYDEDSLYLYGLEGLQSIQVLLEQKPSSISLPNPQQNAYTNTHQYSWQLQGNALHIQNHTATTNKVTLYTIQGTLGIQYIVYGNSTQTIPIPTMFLQKPFILTIQGPQGAQSRILYAQ